MLLHSAREQDKAVLCPAEESGRFHDFPGRHPRDVGHGLRVEPLDRLGQLLEAGRMPVDEIAVDPILFDHHMQETVRQRDVGARAQIQMHVADERRLRLPRISDDELGAEIARSPDVRHR